MEMLMTEKQKPASKPADEDEPATSARLFVEDVKRLRKLKALRGDDSIAITFREVFRKLLVTNLVRASEKTAKEEDQG